MGLPKDVVDVGDGFWNIRGSFKVGGLVDVRTHCSLVRLASGKFVFLDAYALPDEVKAWVDAQTDGGKAVEAILKAAKTGQIGDGKIFIYDLDQTVRIRTGESGVEAV